MNFQLTGENAYQMDNLSNLATGAKKKALDDDWSPANVLESYESRFWGEEEWLRATEYWHHGSGEVLYDDAAWQLRKESPFPRCELCHTELEGMMASANAPNRLCFLCDEQLKTFPETYPEVAEVTKAVSDTAFHVAILRQQASDCREAADDTNDDDERQECLLKARQLDSRAYQLAHNEPWFGEWYSAPYGPTRINPMWSYSITDRFVKRLCAQGTIHRAKVQTYIDQLRFLANRIELTTEELNCLNPLEYEAKHMWGWTVPLTSDERNYLDQYPF